MALGSAVGLWKLLTPKVVLGDDIPEFLEQAMSGSGFITIVDIDKLPNGESGFASVN